MMNFINNQKSAKGFTLIELMIVVAIIGILAAIAIPQFSEYRKKAFNSAATSDLRNHMTAEEAQFADTQKYTTSLTTAKASKNVTVNAVVFNSDTEYTIYTSHSSGDKSYAGDQAGLMRVSNTANLGNSTAQLTSSWGDADL